MGVLDDAIKEHLELKRKHGVPEEELQRQEEEALGPARRDVAQQPEDDTELEPGQPVAADSEGDGALVATEPEEPAVVQDTAAVEDAPVAEHETPMPEHEPPVVEQDTALFDMEQDAAETEAEAASAPATEETQVPPAPVEASMPEETAVDEPTAIHEVVEPTPVEPPPVEPPPAAEEPHPHDEAPVGEPGHEPDPDDRLGETQPHGFDAVEEDELAEEDEPLEPAEDEEDILASDPEDEELDVLEDTPDFLQETPEHDRLWFEQKPPRDFDFD
jgi:hypothetical protein